MSKHTKIILKANQVAGVFYHALTVPATIKLVYRPIEVTIALADPKIERDPKT